MDGQLQGIGNKEKKKGKTTQTVTLALSCCHELLFVIDCNHSLNKSYLKGFFWPQYLPKLNMRIPAYGSVMLTIFFIESFICSDAMIKLDSVKKKKKKTIAKRRAVSTIQTNFKLKNIYIHRCWAWHSHDDNCFLWKESMLRTGAQTRGKEINTHKNKENFSQILRSSC